LEIIPINLLILPIILAVKSGTCKAPSVKLVVLKTPRNNYFVGGRQLQVSIIKSYL